MCEGESVLPIFHNRNEPTMHQYRDVFTNIIFSGESGMKIPDLE
jgi:hypothetical protein